MRLPPCNADGEHPAGIVVDAGSVAKMPVQTSYQSVGSALDSAAQTEQSFRGKVASTPSTLRGSVRAGILQQDKSPSFSEWIYSFA